MRVTTVQVLVGLSVYHYRLRGGKVNFRWRVRPLPTVSADVGHSVDVGLVDLGVRRVCKADGFLIGVMCHNLVRRGHHHDV